MLPTLVTCAASALLFGCQFANAIDVDLDNQQSIRDAAATIAYDMMTRYKGNQTGGIIGVLPGPPPNPPDGYYWWESGAMWGTMIDYWHYTGDTSYNDVASFGIQAQVGENQDMMPSNWSQSMGNDDQAFWGMTAMLAAETKFPDPPANTPGWIAMAQAVFNTQQRRPGPECGGGLRWQVYPYLQGYKYKNSISNGCFFNIGARLARYTGNDTYAKEAVKAWDWTRSVGYINPENYDIYDGAHIDFNCTDINKVQFSYNMAVFTLGAANMYNYTNGSAEWKGHLDGLLASTFRVFFPDDIAYEVACEPRLTCTTDMYSFKAYLLRWLAATTKVAPYTTDLIMPKLRASAKAAAAQCTGGANGRQCGLSWSKGSWDGTQGVGQEMAAMSALFVNLLPLKDVPPPVTNATGGTSAGNPNAGADSATTLAPMKPATTGDRVGAGILTTLILISAVGTFGWMSY